LLLNGRGHYRKWTIARTGDEIFLLAEIAFKTFRGKNLSNALESLLCIIIIGNDDLIIEYIAVRERHPLQGEGHEQEDDSFLPVPAPETLLKIECSIIASVTFGQCTNCFLFFRCGFLHGG